MNRRRGECVVRSALPSYPHLLEQHVDHVRGEEPRQSESFGSCQSVCNKVLPLVAAKALFIQLVQHGEELSPIQYLGTDTIVFSKCLLPLRTATPPQLPSVANITIANLLGLALHHHFDHKVRKLSWLLSNTWQSQAFQNHLHQSAIALAPLHRIDQNSRRLCSQHSLKEYLSMNTTTGQETSTASPLNPKLARQGQETSKACQSCLFPSQK